MPASGGSQPVVRRPISRGRAPGGEKKPIEGQKTPEQKPRVREDITTRKPGDATGNSTGDQAGKGKTKTDAGKSNQPPEDIYRDLAAGAESKSVRQDDYIQQKAEKGSQGDKSILPYEKEVAKKVDEIIRNDDVLRRFPQVQEYVKKRIGALESWQQVEVAEAVHEWTRNPELRHKFKKLTDEHLRTIFEEIGISKDRPRPTARDRAQGVIQDIDTLLNKEVVKLQTNADEILKLREQLANAKDPEVVKLATDPRLWEEATKPPHPQDTRTSTEREYQANSAAEKFTVSVKEQSDRELAHKERKRLWRLIGLQILLSAMHAAIPPER